MPAVSGNRSELISCQWSPTAAEITFYWTTCFQKSRDAGQLIMKTVTKHTNVRKKLVLPLRKKIYTNMKNFLVTIGNFIYIIVCVSLIEKETQDFLVIIY